MKVKNAHPRLRDTSLGVLLDVTPEAAVFGLECDTAISLPVESWISRPEDSGVETAVTRFALLLKSILDGPAAEAIAERRIDVFEFFMIWQEPNQPSEKTGFVVLCTKDRKGEPAVVVLLQDELKQFLH